MLEYIPYLIIFIGFVVTAVAIFYKSEKLKLKETGIHVEGIVFKQEVSNSFNDSFSDNYNNQKDKVTVRFVTKKGEWITGLIQQDFQIFYTGQYKDGEKIQVYYDEKNSSHFYVDSKQSDTIGRAIIALAGIAVIIYGIYDILT
jgi:hypothetical protein